MNKNFLFIIAILLSFHRTFAQEVKITNPTVIQDNNYSARGNNNEEILIIKLATSGINPVEFSSLKMNMNGTTNVKDVAQILIYQKTTKGQFDPRNPLKSSVLLGTTKPSKRDIVIPLKGKLASDTTCIYVTYDVREKAGEGNKLDASVISLTAGSYTHFFKAGNPEGAREILLRRTLVYTPNDYGSKNYRIPAIITAKDGSLVILTDKRKFNGTDLPEDIDVVANRSTDGGKKWSEPVTVAEGKGRGKGFGDALIMKAKSGKLVALFVGGTGLWGSTANNPQRTYVSTSTDNGIT